MFTRLIAAAEARRAAHAKRLRGKGGDVADAERQHSGALRDAANEIRRLLADAGNTPTSTTMNAVTETLQALPGAAPLGRLTEPLKLVGFEALAGLVPTSERTLRALTPPPPAPAARAGESTAAGHRHEAQQKKREAEIRRREIAATKKALGAATRDARHAEAAVESAKRTLTSARQERDRLQDQLQFALKKIDAAAAELREREATHTTAKQEVARLEEKLRIY